ncbi:gypsy/ty3 retroelement polyprotein [Tanacetum coccineum]
MGWTMYVEAILKRFGAVNKDLMARLKNLKYESSMKEYQSKFEQLLSQADNTESQYVNMFIARFPTRIDMTWSLQVSPSEEDFELDKPKIEQLGSEELDKRGHELFMGKEAWNGFVSSIVSNVAPSIPNQGLDLSGGDLNETSDSNKEGPLKIVGLKDASQGDKDNARPIAARAMCLLRSEMS